MVNKSKILSDLSKIAVDAMSTFSSLRKEIETMVSLRVNKVINKMNLVKRDEFDALPARELQKMIGDPVLVKFVFEDRNYSLEQLVAVVKRVKMWGRK